jgi:hypothetical protein
MLTHATDVRRVWRRRTLLWNNSLPSLEYLISLP